MISCSLAGGLGNMMFQIAATSAAAWRHRDGAVFYLNDNWGIVHKMAYEYQDNIFRNLIKSGTPLTMWSLQEYMDHPYKELPYRKHTLRKGYFQSEKFFVDKKDQVYNLFKPREEDIVHIKTNYGELLNMDCISIHIRRGDYEGLEHNHPILPIDYYTKAISLLPECDYILVFSDDIEWCKENLLGTPYFNKLRFITDVDFIEMYMMSMCNHNVIANSTFSWWGAWLNQNKDKKVIAPKKWFGPNLARIDIQDIIPEGWIKIWI